MSVIYIKRRAKYVLFYLWKFLLRLLFPPSHFVFCQRHVHQHREPEKSRKFCEPTWKLNFLLPASHSSTLYFRFLIGHCVCTIPWKEIGLKLLYYSEVNLHENLLWYLWLRSSHLIVVSSYHSFKLPLALLFQWHLFYPICSDILSSIKPGFMITAIWGLDTIKNYSNFIWDIGLVSSFKYQLSPIKWLNFLKKYWNR